MMLIQDLSGNGFSYNYTGSPYVGPSSVNDGSGTITLGGTDQLLFAANAGRRGLLIQNQSSGDLYVNLVGGTATGTQPSLWLPAGSELTLDANSVGGSAIRIYGATTGQAFVAEEFYQ